MNAFILNSVVEYEFIFSYVVELDSLNNTLKRSNILNYVDKSEKSLLCGWMWTEF